MGFDVNKKRQMKLHFPPGNVIGAFNVLFNQKSHFIYKCKLDILAYAIRKPNFFCLDEEYPDMFLNLKKKLVKGYMENIRMPLITMKQQELELL